MSQDLTGSDRSARVGTVYRRNVRVCTTCDQRLDTTAARRACEGVGHRIELRAQRIWWIKYYADGGWRHVSSHSEHQQVAQDLLRAREGRLAQMVALTAPYGEVMFADAADDIVADYRMNKKRSLRTLTLRIEKHLRPVPGALVSSRGRHNGEWQGRSRGAAHITAGTKGVSRIVEQNGRAPGPPSDCKMKRAGSPDEESGPRCREAERRN